MAVSSVLTTTVVTIIAAIKGNSAQAQALAAQTQANANQQALHTLSTRVQGHDQQINTIALQMPPVPGVANAPAQTPNAQ
jgi:hypothetical protein